MTHRPRWVAVLAICLIVSDVFTSINAGTQTFVTPRGEAQNVRFEQRDAGILHIFYDLSSSDPRAVFTVMLEASQDSGTTFGMRPQTVSGDVGEGVAPGVGKRIVWDSGRDVERVQIDQFRFRIVAVGGPLSVKPSEPPTRAPTAPTAAPPPNTQPPPPAPSAKRGGIGKWLLLTGAVGAAGAVAIVAAGRGDTSTSGGAGSCFPLEQTPASRIVDAGGGTFTMVLATAASCSWTLRQDDSWITPSPTSGRGTATIQYTVAPNTGPQRSGRFSISTGDGGTSHNVTQFSRATTFRAPIVAGIVPTLTIENGQVVESVVTVSWGSSMRTYVMSQASVAGNAVTVQFVPLASRDPLRDMVLTGTISGDGRTIAGTMRWRAADNNGLAVSVPTTLVLDF